MTSLTVAEWAKRLHVSRRTVYRRLEKTGLRSGLCQGMSQENGKTLVPESRIKLAFPDYKTAATAEQKLLTELVKKIDDMHEFQEELRRSVEKLGDVVIALVGDDK